MEVSEVRAKIKEIVSTVSSIPVDEIGDHASYRDDLDLDSLTLLEIGVDMDYEFKLGLPEDRLQDIRSIQDAVEVVMEHLGAPQAKVA